MKRVSEQVIVATLRDFGCTERESQDYMQLAKAGIQKAMDVASHLKMHKAQVYTILKKLQTLGFVESTLDQDVQVQVIGNKTDSKDGATDVGPAQTCPSRDNISISPAWEQWCPYAGIRITAGAAPASGLLTVSVVVQE